MIQMKKILFAIFLILLWVHGSYEGDNSAALWVTLFLGGAVFASRDEKRARKKVRR